VDPVVGPDDGLEDDGDGHTGLEEEVNTGLEEEIHTGLEEEVHLGLGDVVQSGLFVGVVGQYVGFDDDAWTGLPVLH